MYQLTEEGKNYLKNGLPEKNLLKILPKTMAELSKVPNATIAIGWARKNGWVRVTNGVVEVTDSGQEAIGTKTDTELSLEKVKNKGTSDLDKILFSRKLIEEAKEKPIIETKEGFFKKIFGKKDEEPQQVEIKEIAQLTPELLIAGAWKKVPMKNYDILAPAPKAYPGKKQHYAQFIEEIKEKLVGLGFQEMHGPVVETSFWNCDALFMPQDHPARGVHDVLLLKGNMKGQLPDKNVLAKVKATHEGGWVTGSTGWGGEWKEELAEKLMMRSQTTAVSARTLLMNGDRPGKYFTIDRNFRYDIIDAKHLAEFDQCEGIVIGENLTFKHLLGYLKEFANMIGADKVKFKPSYFPFTEPSAELYAKMPGHGWVEIGGSGMLRPEVLRPLGIEKCQVLAWGLGIGRLAMIKNNLTDIRMLYPTDLKWSRENPLVK